MKPNNLKIYNSLTRKEELFEPLVPGKVSMYVCGPTVYSYIHIGNARPVIFFDVVHRYLQTLGYDVNYVMNYTDVDDKLIQKAEEMNTTVQHVAATFIEAFEEDVRALKIAKGVHPRVTDNIPEIIAFITSLQNSGYAYESGGDVFFRAHKFAEYGKLSQQNFEKLQFGKRIEVDERKENPQDFVLWKQAKPGEIHWSSPWGEGRPGWHIECSAMAHKYLGETIDIHGGGVDLQFPHHECEIAQSESFTGKPFARYWMHNGYIEMHNEKMSKSVGNVIQVHEILKHVRPEAVRLFMLSSHYRSPLQYADDSFKQAEQSLARIQNAADNLNHRLHTAVAADDGSSAQVLQRLESHLADFHAKMQADFNTPDAITALYELVGEVNHYLERQQTDRHVLEKAVAFMQEIDHSLGLLNKPEENEALVDEEIEQFIAEREEARAAKNWQRADEIRDILLARGIVLEDTAQGLRWKRK